jgi:glucose-1-phosphatase
MREQKYKAVIFDLGKVVFDYSFSKAYQFWATVTNTDFDTIKSNFSFDKSFQAFESGIISPERFRNDINQKLKLNLSKEDFDRGWSNIYLDKYDGIDKILSDLKRNYKLIALTNTNIIHNPVWREKYFDTLQYFDKVFCSYELGTRKPEKKVFEIALDYLQSKAKETVFLDDNFENIKGASKLGIATIWVTSQEKMYTELRQMGLLN